MKARKRPFTDSLSYTLTKNSLLVTLVVGLFLSCIQIGVDFVREQDAIEQFASEILAANQFAAADATFHLDTPAAEEVAKGILQYQFITSVIITNESDEVLTQRTSENVKRAENVEGYEIFGEIKNFNQPLYLKSGENIGNLSIYIDPVLASEGFLDRSVLVLLSGLVRNILLAFILVFLFYKTTTKKVLAIAVALNNIDLTNQSKKSLPPINNKHKNELDDLGDSINRLLGIIYNDMQKREQREKALLDSQKELTYQANHDVLSGLVNRRGFELHLSYAMETKQAENAEHVFCYLDLDQFKVINDTCGHIAGDELLRQISQLLKKHIRKHDVLARLGGDEFGILMVNCGIEDAKSIAQKLIDKVSRYRFLWEDKPFAISVSIGIAPVSDCINNANDLLRNADIACYAAKDAGRNCFRIYTESVLDIAKVHGEMQWVTKINWALENNKFCLYAQIIQPNVLTDTCGFHYEVLLRMVDESGLLVSPNAFLPAAERYHLMTKIDKWVIRNQFDYLSKNPEHLASLELCSINLSGPSLTAPGFLQAVIDYLNYYQIPAEKICFEITETAAISNLTDATNFIDAMHKKGCSFALDDFGTGLSSFAYLKYLPVDFLKIDGLFVKGIVDDPIDYAMVKSIHEVGRVMGKKTVAEFVENSDVVLKLKEIGVDYSQGYGIAKPCPIEELNFYR
ncbi:EAL domain-containing protein [uncultured Paraglaciecola sp.]|uniref:EAL domain-containing protein n=1 Tax=uncultured Paraglaciecola sp. TaxID=1765024 RepID=UPI0025EB810D|nr:EAL domain-containing protein [uncultured Paraglaciecola sp.]